VAQDAQPGLRAQGGGLNPTRGTLTTRAAQSPLLTSVAAIFAAVFMAAVLVKYGTLYATALIVLPLGAWFLLARPGVGLFAAIAVTLVVPHDVSHVWLAPPAAILGGLLAGGVRPRFRMLDVVIGALALWLTFSWMTHPENGITTKTFLQGVLPFVLYYGIRFTVDRRNFRTALWVVAIAGFIAGLSVLFDWATGTVHFSDPAFYQWADKKEIFRAGGIFGGSPAAGVGLALVLVACASLWRGSRRAKWFLGVAVAVLGWGLIIVYARAAWVGVALGLIAIVLLLPVRERRIRASIAVGLGAIALLSLYFSFSGTSLSNRLATNQIYQQGIVRPGSAQGREEFLSLALPLVTDSREHFLFGRGFNAFQGNFHDANAASTFVLVERGGPHDEYLRAFLEEGVVGFILEVAWIGGAIWLGVRTARRLPKRSSQRLLISTLTGSMVTFAGACFFHDWLHSPVTVALAALVTGLLVTAADQAPIAANDEVAEPESRVPARRRTYDRAPVPA
jgi:O-antigen ligase